MPMNCETTRALLEAYLDGELDHAEARELEAHVDACVHCRTALTRLDELRRALRAPELRYVAPGALRQRLAATADTSGMPARHSHRGMPIWLRLAAVFVLALGTGAAGMRWWDASVGAERIGLAHDLFAAHWRALAATSAIDVASSDRHTVKPWFAGRVARSPLVRDFATEGFPLLGGRIDYVGGERVPVLVYRHGHHLIDVFVLASTDASALAPTVRQGYAVAPITLGGQPAAVVSDMDEPELRALGQLLSSDR